LDILSDGGFLLGIEVMIRLYILRFILSVRWAYFHISPSYIKFYMDSERTEAHFQHKKYGTLHSNYKVDLKSGK